MFIDFQPIENCVYRSICQNKNYIYISQIQVKNAVSILLSHILQIMNHNTKDPIKIEKPSLRFRGALKNLCKEQKEKNNQDVQNLRNEWQRDI